jgi:PKD repeat protein
MGNANISDSDIQNALDALNKNVNGQSNKFLAFQSGYPKTPDIFAALRGVGNVEFRLARLDPLGNSTNGIVRVQSEYTNGTEPNNLVKSLSYWNSYQYLNIWVVSKINSNNSGTTLGYAQFPWGGMSTDGIVILYGEMDDIQSTTLTHEVGHWLGLCHTWDCGGGSCGDDGVFDTPPQHTSNGFTTDPGADPATPNPSKFPWHVGLPSGTFYGCQADSLNPAGEMFMNYMDYTNDDYCTMFSKGQVTVFDETLVGDTTQYGFRIHIWSDDNILATGTADGYLAPTCTKKVFFDENLSHYSLCLGSPNVLKGNKSIFGNSISKWEWDFGDGTTDSTGNNSPQHIYSSEGAYDVSLTVEYDETTEARANDISDLDITSASFYDSIVSTLIVQGTQTELSAMDASNINLHLDVDTFSLNSKWVYNQPVDSIIGAHSSVFLGIDTFIIYFPIDILSGDSLASVEIVRLALCDSTWEQDSIIYTGDTLIFYFGQFVSDAYDAYYMDTLFYRGEIEKTTYIAYYTNSCTSTITKSNFITVLPTTAPNNASSYAYSFESASELGTDWIANTIEEDENIWDFSTITNKTWERIDGVASDGNASVMIEARDGLSLGESVIVSAAYDLSGFTNPVIKFSYSGAGVHSYPVNELNVFYSNDCGWSWKSLGSLTPQEVVDAGLYNSSFKPKSSDWNDTIMFDRLGPNALQDDNIRFKFEYVTNGSSNNFYLDNIQIGEESALFQNTNENNARLAVYPNPTNGEVTIVIEHLADRDVEVKLVNILGAEVMHLFEGNVISNYQSIDADLSNLENGIYFISVYADGKSIVTDKLILYK